MRTYSRKRNVHFYIVLDLLIKMSKSLCCIEKCLTKSNSIKVKDIIYYLFPKDTEWADKWEKKLKEFNPNYVRKVDDKICSLHFAKSSMNPANRQLQDHAIPVNFPQLKEAVQTNSNNNNVTTCCINSCNTKFTVDSKIHGFKFPEADNQRKLWIYFIRLHNSQQLDWKPEMKICELHFPKNNFTSSGGLNDMAKPTVFGDAIERRRNEIAQRPEISSQYRHPVACVPSSIQKCAAINVRRSSIPYPKLAPRPDGEQLNRKSMPLTSTKLMPTPQTASKIITLARPVPALKAVIEKPIGRSFISQSNVGSSTFLNKSADKTSTEVPMIVHMSNGGNNTTPMVHSLFVPNSNLKTYSKVGLPTDEYTKPQTSMRAVAHSNVASSSKYDRLPSHVIIIDENDLAKTKPNAGTINLGKNDASDKYDISIIKRPGERRQYIIKSEDALHFPRVLSKRIFENRRKINKTSAEVLALRKAYFKLANTIRLQNITFNTETIDIS